MTVCPSIVVQDTFTRRLVDICRQVQVQGPAQNVYLGIHRSDYMLHHDKDPPQLLQVELNTIASSFGCLSALACQMHRYGFCTGSGSSIPLVNIAY